MSSIETNFNRVLGTIWRFVLVMFITSFSLQFMLLSYVTFAGPLINGPSPLLTVLWLLIIPPHIILRARWPEERATIDTLKQLFLYIAITGTLLGTIVGMIINIGTYFIILPDISLSIYGGLFGLCLLYPVLRITSFVTARWDISPMMHDSRE